MTNAIRVLHVDDEPDFAEMVAEFLERQDDRLTVETARDVSEALGHLAQTAVDCVVSDYDMPGQNGIEFLQTVREDFPDLPFILYTGKGSEEVASDAISAGVSDYLQKAAGTEQYELLANRITNAVDQNRTQQQLQAQRHQIEQLHEATRELMGAETRTEIAKLASDIAREILGLPLNGIHFHDPDQNGLVPIAFTDGVRDVFGEPPVIGPGDGIAWTAFETGEPQIHGDVRDAPEVLNPETPIRSEFHLPLGEHGVLVVASTEPDDFSDTDVTTAKILAANVEAALDRAVREQELRERTQQLDGVLDSIEAPVWMRDAESRFLLINEEFHDLFGLTEVEIVGKTPGDLFSGETARQFIANDREAIETETSVEFEETVSTEHGFRTYLTRIRPLFDDDGELYATCGVASDITERKERERELARLEQYNREIIENAPMGIFRLDSEMRIIDENPRAEEIIGMPEGADISPAIGKDIRGLPSVKNTNVADELDRLQTGKTVSFDTEFESILGKKSHLIGKGVPLHDNGDFDGAIIMVTDISDRVQRQWELERTRDLLNHTEQIADVGGWEIDPETEEVFWTDHLFDLLGVNYDEVPRLEETLDVIHEEDRRQVEQTLQAALTAGDSFDIEARYRRPDGEVRWFRIEADPTMEDGDVVNVRGAVQDITDRKDRERELEEERDRFRAVFEEAFDAMVLADDTGRYTDANDSATELFGLPKDQLLDRSIKDFAPADFDFESEWKEFQESKDERGIFPLVRADGTERIVEYAATTNIIPGEHLSVLRDITEEHDYEQIIEHLHHTAQEIFRAETDEQVAEVMIEAVDGILGIPINGVAMYDASENVLQPVAETDESQHLIDGMPTFRPGESLAWEVFETGRIAHYDDVSTVPNRHNPETPIRSEIILPLGGHGVALLGSTEVGAFDETDISLIETLANHAESALDRIDRERELELYRTMIETIPDGVYALDDDLRYIAVNEGMEQLTGYSEEELIGSHVSLILPEETAETSEQNRQKIRESSEDLVIQFERTHYKADGTPVRCNVRFRALPTDDDGRFRGTVGVLRDVSEQRQREQELERQNTRLEEFASIVSHDLRNPLDVAQGRVELARDDCDSDHLDDIARAHDRMEALIADLLTLAREGEHITEKERVELGSLIEMCWRNVPTRDATVRIDIDRTVLADRSRLTQLLENLIRNAIEHGGEDVTISVGELTDGFYIEDDGPGIPVGDRDAVFDPGYSTADAGTGFGLSIVKQVAEAHNWEVMVTEGSDGGARFEITGVEFAE